MPWEEEFCSGFSDLEEEKEPGIGEQEKVRETLLLRLFQSVSFSSKCSANQSVVLWGILF
jgi:hypothetical protein